MIAQRLKMFYFVVSSKIYMTFVKHTQLKNFKFFEKSKLDKVKV